MKQGKKGRIVFSKRPWPKTFLNKSVAFAELSGAADILPAPFMDIRIIRQFAND
jgi:hypothetical protein